MMDNRSVFHLSGIEIAQSDRLHKVGSDAIVLSDFVYDESARTILDIGTGTGVIALRMAQKHPYALVHALDVEPEAADLASYNFERSNFRDRLTCFLADLCDFCTTAHQAFYDLIVCNPPYFHEQVVSPDPVRVRARNAASLEPELLFRSARYLLKPHGTLTIIVPTRRAYAYHEAAALQGLYFNVIGRVVQKDGRAVDRVVLTYSRNANVFRYEKCQLGVTTL